MTDDVSDNAVAPTASLARDFVILDRNVPHGQRPLTPVDPLHRFGTRTFGAVGLGMAGSATAQKARGLGCKATGGRHLPACSVGRNRPVLDGRSGTSTNEADRTTRNRRSAPWRTWRAHALAAGRGTCTTPSCWR